VISALNLGSFPQGLRSCLFRGLLGGLWIKCVDLEGIEVTVSWA
jgi:hypothetical protein